MTLNDAYLISPIAAVVLVAPTLLYLALQVRQNTLQMRAQARFQWVDASGQINVRLDVACKDFAFLDAFYVWEDRAYYLWGFGTLRAQQFRSVLEALGMAVDEAEGNAQ